MTGIDQLRRQPLLRLFAINLALGTALAALAVAGLLALDAHRLSTLVMADRSPVIAIGLLLFGFVITFGGAVVSTAVMRIGRTDPPPGSNGGAGVPLDGVVRHERAPVRVIAR